MKILIQSLGAAQQLPTDPQKRMGQMQITNFTIHPVYVTNKVYSIFLMTDLETGCVHRGSDLSFQKAGLEYLSIWCQWISLNAQPFSLSLSSEQWLQPNGGCLLILISACSAPAPAKRRECSGYLFLEFKGLFFPRSSLQGQKVTYFITPCQIVSLVDLCFPFGV